MSNLYRQLRDLLPEPPLLRAVVAADHGDGSCTVTYPGGSPQRVRGSAAVNASVFVRNGVIEGSAPELEAVTVEV